MGLDDAVIQHIDKQMAAFKPSLVKQVGVAVASMVPTFALLAGLVWAAARPAALQFINDVIDGHRLATDYRVDMIVDRIGKVEAVNGEQDRSINGFTTHGAVIDEKLTTIVKQLTEQGADLKEVLRATKK